MIKIFTIQLKIMEGIKLASHEVIKHSAAIHISNTLTRTQRMVSNILLKNAYKNLLVSSTHKMEVSDLITAVGFESHNIEVLKNILSILNTTQMEWNILDKDKKNSWGISTILASAEIKKGICEYAYSPGMCKIFSNPNIYARLNLLVQRQFKRGHTLAIWEYLTEFLCSKGFEAGYTEWLSVKAFKKLLGVQKDPLYDEFKYISQRLIREPLKEINAVSDINAKSEYKREKRRVIALRFQVSRKINYQMPLDLSLPLALTEENEEEGNAVANQIINKNLFNRLILLGLTDKQAKDCLTLHNESYITGNLDLVEKKQKEQKIENLSAYTISALKEDYRLRKTPIELKQDVEKLAMKAQQDAEQLVANLEKKHIRVYRDKTDTLFQNLSESEKEKSFNEFEKKIKSDSYIYNWLKTEGLKNLSVKREFSEFLAEKHLKPEELNFVLWAKNQGHTIKEIEGGNSGKKYLLLNN